MINTLQASLNLLMIDDDPDDMLLFEEAVSKSAFNINFSVTDLSVFYNTIELNRPDVILMDINMPLKSGPEFLSI